MSIKVASWNLELRLSRYTKTGRGSPEQIIKSIRQLDADIIFLPEAYDANVPIDKSVTQALKLMKYAFYDVPYDEGGPKRQDCPFMIPYLRILSRIPVIDIKTIRLGILRNALICSFKDTESNQILRIIGIHLDDRSERLRLSELPELIPIINSSNLPTVMVGDYNAMNGSTKKAKFLRSKFIKLIINLLPGKELRSYAVRATEMATGTVLSKLESETNLHDVDINHKPTTTPKLRTISWMPSICLIDIDHMLVSNQITVKDFQIAKHDGGSDHRSISATIYLQN